MNAPRVLRDRHIVLLAVAAIGGALVARPLPVGLRLVAVAAGLVGLAGRRPVPLVIGALLTASALAASSWAGLAPPRTRVVTREWVTLITDPAPFDGGTLGAEVRLDRRHVQAWARGPAGAALAPRLAGERVQLTGVLRPLQPGAARAAAARHVSARLSVHEVTGFRSANLIGGVANRYRRLVTRGAASLPERLRPLFGGMVMGDDRGQPPELADAFRAAGLTHLLAVSGQNVAFVLILAVPVLRRGGLRWRLALTLAVLVAFGILTRWEPSVMRAEAMAVVAALGTFTGRPVRGVRLLALAVTACVLVDPLLVRSVGFQLSVAACAGLVALTPLLASRLPLLVAASIAAQAGAAVVLIPTFGGVPIVALPANVLAVPAAGPIMMWGLVVGPLAGLAPGLAGILHAPTRVALVWVAGVAEISARVPLAPLGGLATALAVTAILAAARSPAAVVRIGAALTLLVLIALAAAPPSPTDGQQIAGGAQLWVRGGDRVLVVSGGRATKTLAALRNRHVHRVDVLVTTNAGRVAADRAWPLVHVLRPRLVLAPEHHQLAPARTFRRGATATAGGLAIEVVDDGPPLAVLVSAHTVAAHSSSPSHSRSSLSKASLRASNCSFQCSAASAVGYGPS